MDVQGGACLEVKVFASAPRPFRASVGWNGLQQFFVKTPLHALGAQDSRSNGRSEGTYLQTDRHPVDSNHLLCLTCCFLFPTRHLHNTRFSHRRFCLKQIQRLVDLSLIPGFWALSMGLECLATLTLQTSQNQPMYLNLQRGVKHGDLQVV